MQTPFVFHSNSAQETTTLAQGFAQHCMPGDLLLLSGDVGAGKTHFARAFIQNHLPNEDVPSPSFTLVQTYTIDDLEIWHIDLYRITSTAEIEELGLAEALDNAICLIEWPDRLGSECSKDAIEIHLEMTDTLQSRQITFNWSNTKWDHIIRELTDG